MIVFSAFFYAGERIRIYKDFDQTVISVTDRLAFNLIQPLWYTDSETMEKLINYEKGNRIITGIVIKDDTDNAIFSKNRNQKNEFADFRMSDKFKYFKKQTKDVVRDNEKLGSLELYFTDKVYRDELFASLIKILTMFVIFFIVLLIVLYMAFKKLILQHLYHIFSYIQDLSKGDINKKIDITSNDEIGILSDLGKTGSVDMEETIKSIHGITELTDVINEMIGVIRNISQKINLLSMNAAIETAHAGEAGAGSAVVDEEVRTLSEDTKQSIDSISKSLVSIIAKINEAEAITLKTKESMESIINGINEEFTSLQKMITVYEELIAHNNYMKEVFSNLEEAVNNNEKSSAELNVNYGIILNSISEIQKLSEVNLKSVIAINAGIIHISKTPANISKDSLENTKMVGEIEKEMNFFKS